MPAAQLPVDESERIRTLDSYLLLDTSPEPVFDNLTTTAATTTGAPSSLISLVDRDRQWFKSRHGFVESETPRDHSFCAHAILDRGPLVVDDATADDRFADNPLVTATDGIRAYLGVPILARDHRALGTLCVIDTRPRQFDEHEKRTVELLARQVEIMIELRKMHRLSAANAAELQRRINGHRDELESTLQAVRALHHLLVADIISSLDDDGDLNLVLEAAGHLDYLSGSLT